MIIKDDNLKKAIELLKERKILSQAYLMRKCRLSAREADRVIKELENVATSCCQIAKQPVA